ncbi:MAG: hypothetical protein IPK83_23180 [Planctomycetes bacterium]|nr:hypothetical protein [Planctomycetota bacterium]
MTATPTTLGLIAGEGEFPKLVARGAKAAGLRVVVVGLAGTHDPAIREMADAYYQAGIARLGRWIRLFRREGVSQAIMAGRVRKLRIVEMPLWRQVLAYLPDWASIKVWFTARDRRNDTLLGAVADAMAKKGVALIDSTKYCADAMASEGPLTRRGLSPAQEADAELGWAHRPRNGTAGCGPGGGRVSERHHCGRGDRGHRQNDRTRRLALQKGRLGAREDGKAESGHALRRADHRAEHD